MKLRRLHAWDVTPREAIKIQRSLRSHVILRGRVPSPKLVAGADLSYEKNSNTVYASVVVLKFPSLELVEALALKTRASFPYIPGLLSFREAPPLLRAFRRLRSQPELIFIDGHGRSHPRAAGLACHVGLLLDRPVIGCAKSRLVGTFKEPARGRGSTSRLYDPAGQTIGAVLRTRDGVKPLFVSVGHRIGLREAIRLTLACGTRYRVPEPTRQADALADQAKRLRRSIRITGQERERD